MTAVNRLLMGAMWFAVSSLGHALRPLESTANGPSERPASEEIGNWRQRATSWFFHHLILPTKILLGYKETTYCQVPYVTLPYS